MLIFQTPKKFFWCRTISTRITGHHSTRLSLPTRRDDSSNASKWHYTPKHGSWLDMAESELGALTKQCLDRRIPDKKTIIKEIAAWERERNKNKTKADWQFTTADARVKLKRLYPSF